MRNTGDVILRLSLLSPPMAFLFWEKLPYLATFGVSIQFIMVSFTGHHPSHTLCIPDPQGEAGTPAAMSMLDDANSLVMSDRNTVTPEPGGTSENPHC